MTREQCKQDVKRWQKDSDTGGDFFSVDKLIDKLFSSFEVKEALYEAQLKAKDEEIKILSKKCAEIAYDFEGAVVEIEKLKAIVEEAIRKPMGVEPHS